MPISCTPNDLAYASRCFCGFKDNDAAGMAIYLLCQWANSAEPVARFSYEPETAVIQWTDSGGVHSGDLATFYSTPTWPSTTIIDASSTALPSIDTITGIAFLTNLLTLNVQGMAPSFPTTLDLTGCSTLVWCNCSNSGIDTLILTGCTSLQHLDFNNAEVNAVNLSSCGALLFLDCHGTGGTLASVDVSPCPLITTLDCSANTFLIDVDASGCSFLTTLNCSFCGLGTLDITGAFALVTLDFSNNPSVNIFGP